MDAKAHLNNLRTELVARGWHAEIRETAGRRPVLHVKNPRASSLNEDIACQNVAFNWAWGGVIGPVTAVTEVADRVQHVLREVGA